MLKKKRKLKLNWIELNFQIENQYNSNLKEKLPQVFMQIE